MILIGALCIGLVGGWLYSPAWALRTQWRSYLAPIVAATALTLETIWLDGGTPAALAVLFGVIAGLLLHVLMRLAIARIVKVKWETGHE